MQDVFDMYNQASDPQKVFMVAAAVTLQLAVYVVVSQLVRKLKHRPKE